MSGAVISGPGPSPGISLVAGGSGSLTSSAVVTGGGGGTLQTPSSTTTLDSAGNFTAGGSVKTAKIVAPADTTTAITFYKADGTTAVGTWDTTNSRLKIGAGTAPAASLDVAGNIASTGNFSMGNGSALYLGQAAQRSALYSSGDSQVFMTNGGLTGLSFLTLGPTAPTISDGSVPANAQGLAIVQKSELLTIAAAATSTTTMTIPAGVIVLSINARVTVIIPTAATFTVIGNTSTTVFNTAAVTVAAGSTDPGTAAGAFYNATSQTVRITPNLTPGANTGRVRVTIVYLSAQPPTS